MGGLEHLGRVWVRGNGVIDGKATMSTPNRTEA